VSGEDSGKVGGEVDTHGYAQQEVGKREPGRDMLVGWWSEWEVPGIRWGGVGDREACFV